jgi:hypothetical protein
MSQYCLPAAHNALSRLLLARWRLMLVVTVLVLQIAFCRHIAAQQVQLPARLSQLGTGAFIRFRGLEFSTFAFQEIGGSGINAATVVNGWSDGLFYGLSFDVEGQSLGASGVGGNKELNLSYKVLNVAGTKRIGAAMLSVDANTVGYGLAGAGIGFSDQGGNPPIATSLGFASASSSQLQSTEKSRAVLALRSTTDVLGVAGGINANTYFVGDIAAVRSIKHLYALEDNVLDGDFTFNGVVDGADFLLWKRTYGSALDLQADGSKNGKVDAADYTVWRDAVSSFAKPGDYTGDGVVDQSDYMRWKTEYGSGGGSLTADGNRDGTIDAADYTIWRDNVDAGSSSVPSTSVTVPEPESLGLLLLGGVLAVAFWLKWWRH